MEKFTLSQVVVSLLLIGIILIQPAKSGGMGAAFHGVVVPAVSIDKGDGDQRQAGDQSTFTPAGSAQTAEGPVNHGGDHHIIAKILHQSGATGEHGADGDTGQHHSGGRSATESGQTQKDSGGGNATQDSTQGDHGGVCDGQGGGGATGIDLNTGTEIDDGHSGAKGGTLGNAQGGGGRQRIAQHILHDTAGKGQGHAHHGGGDHTGHAHIPDDGVFLAIAAAKEGPQNIGHAQIGRSGRQRQHSRGK